MYIFIFFIIDLYFSIPTGKGNMIGSVTHKDYFLFAENESTVKLKEIKQNIVSMNNDALISIFRDGGFYNIQFEINNKFLHVNKKNYKVVLADIIFENVETYNTEFGYKFDFEGVKNGMLIHSRGRCLEIIKIGGNFTVKGNYCDPENMEQLFFIKQVEITPDKAGENEDNEMAQGQTDQQEGPIINPILHGPNTKRDPYMYGNEPYRGRKIF